MALRFLGKTSLTGLQPLQIGGHSVIEAHSSLRDALRSRAGDAAADLLAEPVVSWGDSGRGGSVSWYAEGDGDSVPLVTSPPERRQMLEQQLRGVLASMEPLLLDAELGPLLQRALILASPNGIRSIGDRIILVEWGLAPASVSLPLDMTAALAMSPLGRFLPTMQPAAVGPTRPPPVGAGLPPSMPSSGTGLPPVPPPLGAGLPPLGASQGTEMFAGTMLVRGAWNWWLVPAALLLAALFLAFGVWLGARMVAASARPGTVQLFDEAAARDALRRQNEENAILERELEDRRRALAANVCQADPAKMPRLGPDRAATPPPAAVPPPPGAPAFQGNFTDLLKQALVMVLVPGNNALSIGSGFFVTQDLIVTNRHVIAAAQNGRILVLNEKIGRAIKVELVAESPTSEVGSLDVAVLRLTGGPSVQPLSMTTTVAQLDQVVAAGYPGLTLHSDAAWQRTLESGQVTSAPALILTDGRINAIQDATGGLKIMPHSAALSGGNSGGPLVDACGRVVGVNTFIASDQTQTAHANYAQKADQVIAFLRANGIAVSEVSGPCTPGAPPSTAPPLPPDNPAAPSPGAAAPAR